MPSNDDSPTASITTLKHRARLLASIRDFFDRAGFFEVETPLLSADIIVDAWLEPFTAEWIPQARNWKTGGQQYYLQTSPEFAMKRLLAAGADSIYQLGKVFRNGEFGTLHNPEFTMLEWYRANSDLDDLIAFTESLVRRVFEVGAKLAQCNSPSTSHSIRELHAQPFRRLTYREAFFAETDACVLTCSMETLHLIARDRGIIPPPSLAPNDRDGWLNFLLAELIEPKLGIEQPTFLTDYPASQAALARLTDDRQTAKRFELYIDGIELCNGYGELTDPVILRERIREQSAIRSNAGLRPLPNESRLLTAMDRGLRSCTGNALGVDRLIMLALGKWKLADVISFPFDIA